MKNSLTLGLLGFVSGVVSFVVSQKIDDAFYTAGIVFGVCVGIFFVFALFRRSLLYQLPPWVVASMFSYYLAVGTTLEVMDLFAEPYNQHIALFVGGIVGATLMLFSFSILLKTLALTQIIRLVILGGILGLTGLIKIDGLFMLYVCWQTGMAAGLGFVLDQNEKRTIQKTI